MNHTDKNIYVEENENGGRFFTAPRSNLVAQMTYSLTNAGVMIIDHTEVPPPFKGIGLGPQLVELGVERARRFDRKIIALCPYAKHQFEKHPQWHDVLTA